MENFILNRTSYSPEVNFDHKTGVLEISGISIPEDSSKFFQPLMQWLEQYRENPAALTTLIFKMEYFNTSSTVFMLRLMKGVAKLSQEGKNISIHWYHQPNDEDFIEAGRDFAVLAKTHIDLISY